MPLRYSNKLPRSLVRNLRILRRMKKTPYTPRPKVLRFKKTPTEIGDQTRLGYTPRVYRFELKTSKGRKVGGSLSYIPPERSLWVHGIGESVESVIDRKSPYEVSKHSFMGAKDIKYFLEDLAMRFPKVTTLQGSRVTGLHNTINPKKLQEFNLEHVRNNLRKRGRRI